MRFTVKDLRSVIADINVLLEGSPIRLIVGGRNGCQAVDEYPVDTDGNRIGSGINRNVCCGTSKECAFAAWQHYGRRER